MTHQDRTFARPNEPTVADAMTRSPISIAAEASIGDAIARMAESHVSALAVVNPHGKLIGVLSTHDVLAAEAETDDDAALELLRRDTMVRDLMTAPAITITPDLPLKEAALEMEYADIHRLFVEENGRLVGVVSMSDINRAYARQR
ncbi:MAG: CBS domain-containing protein [Gemmatimonadetes bacterium]|nr:CBS domain-containing protein [Gemmatimonadota bacterium]